MNPIFEEILKEKHPLTSLYAGAVIAQIHLYALKLERAMENDYAGFDDIMNVIHEMHEFINETHKIVKEDKPQKPHFNTISQDEVYSENANTPRRY